MDILREIYNNFRQLLIWWVVVAPWEQVIRVRLGKHIKVLNAGVHVKLPVLDVIYKQSIRRRVTATHAQTNTTRDGKVITVSAQVTYEISNLELLYRTLHHAEATLQAELQAAMSEYLVCRNANEITPGHMQSHVRDSVDFSRYGLEKVEIHVTNFATAKTYRLITGEIYGWSEGDSLDTAKSDEDMNGLVSIR
jgi:hypothetical protein